MYFSLENVIFLGGKGRGRDVDKKQGEVRRAPLGLRTPINLPNVHGQGQQAPRKIL